MPDEHLRSLQRGPLESAALLRERLRRGDLEEERLRLAATLGHPPAREALGLEEPYVEAENLVHLTFDFADCGREAWLQAALVLLEHQERDLMESGELSQYGRELSRQTEALRAFLSKDDAKSWENLLEVSRGLCEHKGYAVAAARRVREAPGLRESLASTLLKWALR